MQPSTGVYMRPQRFALTQAQRDAFLHPEALDRENRLSEARYAVKKMIENHAETDLDVLADTQPDLYQLLVETVVEHAEERGEI